MPTPTRAPDSAVKGPTYSADSFGEMGGDSYIRRAGRGLILGLYGALRSIKLYPVENPVVQKALDDLTAAAAEVLRQEGELELRVSRDRKSVV